MGKNKFDFFVSFSNKDMEIVSQVVQSIENVYGAKCWFQLKDSKAEFIDSIMEGIENSRTFILFITPNSANSYFVLNEVNHAIECWQKNSYFKIVPVLLNADEKDMTHDDYKRIRFYLGRLNIIHFRKTDSLEWLVAKIFDQSDFVIKDELKTSLYRTSAIEEERIRFQSEILNNFTKVFWKNVVKENFNILDVGCSNGSNISLHLEGLEYRNLLGIDINSEQVAFANKNFGSNKNKFLCSDITNLDLDDILEDYLDTIDEKSFDLIHISEVLLHLQDPVAVLSKLRRFLKRGGFIFIQDDDDGVNITFPESNFFQLAYNIWGDSKESGDRKCGRKIPSYLKKAGYVNTSLKKCGITNIDLPAEMQSAFWDIYFNHHLWEALSDNMFYHVDETMKLLETYKRLYAGEKEKYDCGEYFIQLGFLFYIANK